MKDIRGPIAKATDSGSSLSVRHEAFAELVIRFQDMAFACAYAVLGDAYLAEDVAQEAFVVAWQKLDQLREPDAFPGWFKRIVRVSVIALPEVSAFRSYRLMWEPTVQPAVPARK